MARLTTLSKEQRLRLAAMAQTPGMVDLRECAEALVLAYFQRCVRSQDVSKEMAQGYEAGVAEIVAVLETALSEVEEEQAKEPRTLATVSFQPGDRLVFGKTDDDDLA